MAELLSVTQHGAALGPPLVLLHGAYMSAQSWAPALPALCEAGWQVWLIELRGHGHMALGDAPWTVESAAAEVVEALAARGVARACVVGHSLGGMVAMVLASGWPALVEGLALVETSYGARARWWEALATELSAPLVLWTPRWLLIPWIVRWMAAGDASLAASLRAELSAYEVKPEAWRAIWRGVTRFDGAGLLAQLRCPVVVLVGANNPQTHAQGRVMAAQIPEARLEVVEGAGHMLPQQRPDALVAALESLRQRRGAGESCDHQQPR